MVAIFGASGHAREVAFILRSLNKSVDCFVSNDNIDKAINGIEIINEDDFFNSAQNSFGKIEAFIAVGNCSIRKKIYEKIMVKNLNIDFPNLIYKQDKIDLIENSISLGEGNIFFPGVVLTIGINIGNHNHFNSNSSISHDCFIGDFNTISPGVNIAGGVTLGNMNFIGMNSAIIDSTTLGENLIIGAGSTVINSIKEPGTYVGTPVRKIK